MSARAEGSKGWLFGPLPDLLFGCGVGYFALYAVSALGGAGFRDAQSAALITLLTLMLSAPHYGGTLLRVYEERSDRRAYTLFSVWATLAVALFLVAGVYQPLVGAWLFTVYITWSPWHYMGQNYGVCLMMLGRRGVQVSPSVKRLLHASFVGSFFITMMVLHGSTQASGYLPNPTGYGDPQITLVTLGIPHELARSVLVIATLVHAGALIAALVLLVRQSGWRPIGPACAIIGLQILWFSLPFSIAYWGIRTGIDPVDHGTLSHYVVWTAMGHSIQYVWVTTFYARSSPRFGSYPRYFLKVLLAGGAIWTLPAVIFASPNLGSGRSAEGVVLLVAAAVNLHHFILDGAIWKLRNSRVASVLIRSAPDAMAPEPVTSTSWLRRGMWAVCGVGTLLAFTTLGIEHGSFVNALGAGDPDRSRAALDWIARAGHENPAKRSAVARLYLQRGDLDSAEDQYRYSLALRPTAPALQGLTAIQTRREDWPGVLETWASYPADAPFDPRLAGAATRAYYALGRRDEGRTLLDDALAHTPGSARDYSRFGDVAQSYRDWPTAVRYYRAALELDPTREAAANNLAWILATSPDAELRDPAEALRLAAGAAQSDDPNQLDTLAAALAAAGRYDEAVATASRAVELARTQQATVADALADRLALYRAGRPYREPSS